jgi:hypothetical protein
MQPVFAIEPVKAISQQLTVVGSRCVIPVPQLCWASTTESRQIVVQAVEPKMADTTTPTGLTPTGLTPTGLNQHGAMPQAIKEFRILATDFDRKDNPGTISGVQVVTSTPHSDAVLPGKFLAIPVQFDLRHATKSGEFSGNLLIEHSEGSLTIPVTLKLKDSWHLAIVVLGLGVSLAVWLGSYQANGLDRDEISSQVARLRSQIQSQISELKDKHSQSVAAIFRFKLEGLLIDVMQHLDAKAWTAARSSLTEAQNIWIRWRKHQPDWIDLHQYVEQSLQTYLKDGLIPADTAGGKELALNLSITQRRLADCQDPEQFIELLKPLQVMFQRYLDAFAQVQVLDRLMALAGNQLEMAQQVEDWRRAVIDCKHRLDALSPSDETAYKTWHETTKQLQTDLEASISQQTMAAKTNTRSYDSHPMTIGVQAVPMMQSVANSKTTIDRQLRLGQSRLWRYEFLGQASMIVLLCGIGLKQLYGINPTFGSDPIADYTGLLAWGFSAEVTRDSVTKVLQRFKSAGI